MMGHRQVEQAALFYEFSLEKHVPPDHLLRSIDRFVELDQVRRELAGFYSRLGPQETGEAGPDTKSQAGLRSRRDDGGASPRRRAPDLLPSIDGLLQQNRPQADIDAAYASRPLATEGKQSHDGLAHSDVREKSDFR